MQGVAGGDALGSFPEILQHRHVCGSTLWSGYLTRCVTVWSDALQGRIGTLSLEKQSKLEKDTAKKEAKAEAKADAEYKKKMVRSCSRCAWRLITGCIWFVGLEGME
jgi:hypothetical protein